MHQTRSAANKRLPIARKGTRYLVRTRDHNEISIPVLVAVRDMLHIAQNLKETKHLIHNKKLKINGRNVRDYRQPIRLMSLFEADKKYKLSLLPTGKFFLDECKDSTRVAKITGKVLVAGGKVQIIFHDGTTLISKENCKIGDSAVLSEDNKIKKIIPVEKGAEIMVISGKSVGKNGKVKHVEGKDVNVSMEGREVVLKNKHVLAI